MKNRPVSEAKIMTREGELSLSVQWLRTGLAVNCESRSGIPKGSVLVRNQEQLKDGQPLFLCYEKGLFSALRGQGSHVGNGYKAEKEKVTLTQGSLAWALEASWGLRHDDEMAQQKYSEVMSEVVQSLIRVRNNLKVTAGEHSTLARSPYDRLGRFNPASRSPLIWSADHLLQRRISVTRYIRRAIDRRKFQLCILLDEIWEMVTGIDRNISHALQLHADGKFAHLRVQKLVDYLDLATDKLRSVKVAPFGIHSFAHCADDLDIAADCFRQSESKQAWEMLDKVDRALKLLNTHRLLEEVMTVVSIVNHTDTQVSELDQESFTIGINQVIVSLETPGLDEGFANPILSDVRNSLFQAVALANDNTGFRAAEVYKCMQNACKCF